LIDFHCIVVSVVCKFGAKVSISNVFVKCFRIFLIFAKVGTRTCLPADGWLRHHGFFCGFFDIKDLRRFAFFEWLGEYWNADQPNGGQVTLMALPTRIFADFF